MAFTCYQAHAYFYKSARAVSHCDDAPGNEGLYRGTRKESTVPPFSEWRPWAGRIESGHFWAEDLRQVRAALLAQGHQPKVTMRSLCDWRALRLRVRDAPDCVVTQYPEDAEILQAWMQKLGLQYRGQRLAGAAAEAFQHLLKAKRLDARASRDRILEEQNYLCKLCSAPIELGACELDHVVPVHQALEGQPQVLQASSRAACLESRVCRSVHEAYVQSPRPPALVCKLAKCDPDRICYGVDVVRCRKNALANATFPLPVFSPWIPWSALGTGTWRTSPTWTCTGTTGRPCSGGSPTWAGAGTASPRPAYLLETGQATWADFKWSLDATAHVEPRCLAQALEAVEDAWPEGEEHMAKLSVNALIGLWARNQELVYSMRTSNHELDGQGCQWRQTFADAAGKVHWDHIYATELFSNYTLRPLHDYVMAQEHVAVAKIRDHLRKVPPRYVVALKTDCLVFQDLPKKFLPAVRELTARKHQDGTPVYRFEECKRLEGEYREPRIEAPYLTSYAPEWRSVEDPLLHCLNGEEPPPLGPARHRQDAPGAPDRGAALRARGGGQARLQDPLLRAEPRRRRSNRGPLRPPEHPERELRAGPPGHRGDHAAGLQPLGRHSGALPQPQGEVPAAGRFPAAARGAGRLRGSAGDEAPQGLPAAPRPGGRLLPRALRKPPERRGHLRLPAVPTRGRGGGAAAARGAAAGPGALPEAGAAGHLPGDQPRQQAAPQRAAQPQAGAGECDHHHLRGPGRGGHQRPANDARLAGPAAGGRGGQGGQGLLRFSGGGGARRREARHGGALQPRGAPAPHAALPRHHLRQLPGPHAAGPGAPVRHHQPALRAAPPVRRRLEGHQRRAAVRALGAFKRREGLGRAPRHRAGLCLIGSKAEDLIPSNTSQALRFGTMAIDMGRIALQWLFSETFPLHTQFVEQPQPLRKWELGKWHDCAAYRWWAKDVRQCMLAGIVPPEQHMLVRLQLQRAGRLCELHRSVNMRDVLRLSAELELPIRPHSWFLGPIHWAGESQEYVDRVFNVAAIVARDGSRPPSWQELASTPSASSIST